MIRELHVERYRSLRDVRVPLSTLNVVVGQNGSGKTNLYRALRLLPEAAAGRLGRTIIDEAGLPSVAYAGGGGPNVDVRAALDDDSSCAHDAAPATTAPATTPPATAPPATTAT